eukprot:441577_1
MSIKIKGSCVRLLNQTYYKTHSSATRYITSDSQYGIYFDALDKQWILADINAKCSTFDIVYYICKYNPTMHNTFSLFQQQPPLSIFGWECVAAHSNNIDIIIEYLNDNSNLNTNKNIKLCIFAKQIIIEPNNIINSGYLLVNNNNIISNIGKHTSSINKLYNKSNCNIFECDILCPGLIDIHTHGIGGNENVLWYYKNPEYTANRLPIFGTTSFLSTIVFSNEYINDIISMCTNQLCSFINNNKNNKGAICEGIHCEGPIIADNGGLPNSSNINKYCMKKFEKFIDLLNNNGMYNNIKIMTISPSIDYKNNFERIKILIKKGIIPALGHDKQCNEQQIIDCLSLINNYNDEKKENNSKYCNMHMTHCFNVQTFHHRNVGLANFAITPLLPNMEKYKNINKMPTIEIIGDLCHISPILIQTILNCHLP